MKSLGNDFFRKTKTLSEVDKPNQILHGGKSFFWETVAKHRCLKMQLVVTVLKFILKDYTGKYGITFHQKSSF